MKTVMLSLIALGALTTAAAADPATLTADQMDHVSAGSGDYADYIPDIEVPDIDVPEFPDIDGKPDMTPPFEVPPVTAPPVGYAE